ncbi:src-like-adapter 2 [Latimeria chalumnae]|uniref:src-like-adapter 2 n=1 Tax=Latimeria chalumnae TaxID=7897 RepID=UPI00313BA022
MGSLPSKRRRVSVHSSNTIQQASTSSSVEDNNKCILVALYNFPSGGQVETAVRIGERLNLISEDGDWWRVASAATGKECYIPSSYIGRVYKRWLYEGISREKAEELLLLEHNRTGSYLIRESQTRRDSYSLSVRRNNNASWDSIKHYRVHRLPNGWFYISPRLTFPSLTDLVDYYSEVGDGLCCTLKEPCFIQASYQVPVQNYPEPVIVRRPTLNWNDVDSSLLFSNEKDVGEDSPVSLGLREAINSYLYMTEDLDFDRTSEKKSKWKT